MKMARFIKLVFLGTFICFTNALSSSNNHSIMDGFSELVSAQISVTIDPLEVVYDKVNQTSHGAYCTLSIHRDNCMNPKIRSNDTIAWSTRICFKWTCSNTTTHVMRIENCWTGSSHRPIFLIDKHGCTRERTMVSTPIYENSLLSAYSVGYLSVRLVGADRIRLSCTIRLCHVCHQQCPAITPPRKCSDSKGIGTYLFTRWNNTNELDQKCRPEEYRRRLAKSSSTSTIPRHSNALILLLLIIHFFH